MDDCCCCGSDCCCSTEVEKKQITIDFLFLDLSVCTRCQGTERALDEAIDEVAQLLKAADMDVTVNRLHIATRGKAIEHKLITSPTIRVNGMDIDTDIKESQCECCGDLCGANVDCRVWTYQGQEYTVPPKSLIINAILSSVYSAKPVAEEYEYVLPKNLDDYFKALERNI